MIFPVAQEEINKLSLEDLREMAGILAYFFANEISKWENTFPTMPLSDKTYSEYQIEFNALMFKPGRPAILKLIKKNE